MNLPNDQLAVAFLQEFMTDETAATIPFSVAAFDLWAEKVGEYLMSEEHHAIIAKRSALKDKINRAALTKNWKRQGNLSFQIMVITSGKTYQIVNIDIAFGHEASRLPTNLSFTVKGAQRKLAKLRHSIDGMSLSPELELRFELIEQVVVNAADQIEAVNKSVRKGFKTIEDKIALMMRKQQIGQARSDLLPGERPPSDPKATLKH